MQRTTTMITILALAASPVLAQGHEQHGQQQQPPRQGMGMMGQGGMQMGGGGAEAMGPLTSIFGRYAPAAVLGMKEHLSLTAEQEAQLTALAEEEKTAVTNAHHPAHAAHMELRKIQDAESPDLEAMRQFFMAHRTAEGNMQWLKVTYAAKARALLTATQRSHVDQMGGGAGQH